MLTFVLITFTIILLHKVIKMKHTVHDDALNLCVHSLPQKNVLERKNEINNTSQFHEHPWLGSSWSNYSHHIE